MRRVLAPLLMIVIDIPDAARGRVTVSFALATVATQLMSLVRAVPPAWVWVVDAVIPAPTLRMQYALKVAFPVTPSVVPTVTAASNA